MRNGESFCYSDTSRNSLLFGGQEPSSRNHNNDHHQHPKYECFVKNASSSSSSENSRRFSVSCLLQLETDYAPKTDDNNIPTTFLKPPTERKRNY